MRPPQSRSIEHLCSLFAHLLQTPEYKKRLAEVAAAEANVRKHGADAIAKSTSSSYSSSSKAKKMTYGGVLEAAQNRAVTERYDVATRVQALAQINTWAEDMHKQGPDSVSLQGLIVLF